MNGDGDASPRPPSSRRSFNCSSNYATFSNDSLPVNTNLSSLVIVAKISGNIIIDNNAKDIPLLWWSEAKWSAS